jgi:metallo-beta-lactamase family protein
VLIPAFSLGRTQLIVHLLQKALLHGRIPRVPIYVDSPLAAEVAEVYRHHAVEFVPEVGDRIEQGLGVLGGDGVQYIRTYQQSSDLTTRPGPHVIISASGMCDAGRVVSHLRQIVDDPRCTVILVSYQAPGTTGRRLSEAKPTVWLQGKECNKWVDVVHLDGFSGHADRDDFVAYLQPMVDQIGKIRLIHAEAEQAEALTELLGTLGYHDVQVPKPADRDTLR